MKPAKFDVTLNATKTNDLFSCTIYNKFAALCGHPSAMTDDEWDLLRLVSGGQVSVVDAEAPCALEKGLMSKSTDGWFNDIKINPITKCIFQPTNEIEDKICPLLLSNLGANQPSPTNASTLTRSALPNRAFPCLIDHYVGSRDEAGRGVGG